MIAVAIIVFREVLEASLIVGIVLAASKGTPGRGRWISGGIALGVLGACVVAGFAAEIAAAVAGMGQEVFNATILFAAVGMLGWHNVWMGRHGKEMAAEASALGRDVAAGTRPLYALASVVGIAVLREGSEVVLFLYGLAAAGGGGLVNMLGGGTIGVIGGGLVGTGLYLGLLRIPSRHLFAVTSWMILLLAAGLASQGAFFLNQADVLPALGNQIWDTSWLLDEDSVAGRVLHVLVGYVARPEGIQLVFWGATLGILLALMRWFSTAPARAVTRAAAVLAIALAGIGVARVARADFTIHPPIVEYGEFEVEHNGSYTFDPNPANKHNETGTLEIGYGVLPWWGTEVEFGWSRTANDPPRRLDEINWENTLQLADQGEYWLDPGIFAEIGKSTRVGNTHHLEIGPTLRKQWGNTVHTINLFFEHPFGPNNDEKSINFNYAWQSLWTWEEEFQPGFEIFGDVGPVDRAPGIRDQQLRIGPVAYGKIDIGRGLGELKYGLGYLLGLTHGTEKDALKWNLEWELVF
jgi:high-affinity iron transporter